MHVNGQQHLHVPVFHAFHAPHLEWIELAHPIRAAAITAGLAASIGAAGLAVESAREAWARTTSPTPAVVEYERRPLAHEWRATGPKVDHRAMIRRGAEVRSVDQMWRRR